MSVTSRGDRSSDLADRTGGDAAAQATPTRLNQPWRAGVAVVELVLAGLAVWLAFTLWSNGVHTIHQPEPLAPGGVVDLTLYDGEKIALAVVAGLAAALLVVDAVRQLLLALRARPRRRRGADDAEPWPSFDEDG